MFFRKWQFQKAAKKGNKKKIKSLLISGIDPNMQNKKGQTALHLASDEGHLEVIKFLIEKGTNIEAQDEEGRTALYDASGAENLRVMEFLIEKGANTKVKNNADEIPFDIAKKKSDKELMELFKNT